MVTAADRAGLPERLAEHGVAFFPNAFSKQECELLIQQFVDNCDVNEVAKFLCMNPLPLLPHYPQAILAMDAQADVHFLLCTVL